MKEILKYEEWNLDTIELASQVATMQKDIIEELQKLKVGFDNVYRALEGTRKRVDKLEGMHEFADQLEHH